MTNRLREAATEHDAWFRAKVREALDGIKDGSNPLIDESEWKSSLIANVPI